MSLPPFCTHPDHFSTDTTAMLAHPCPERPLEPGQRRNVFGEAVCSECGYRPPQHAETCPLDWAPGELVEVHGK